LAKKYAYRYKLKNGAGGGTWITSVAPDQVRKELLKRFIGREMQEFERIGDQSKKNN
jgi:hypothetical protein